MEYYVAEDQRPLDKCLADVEACDLYLLLVAWRYGHIPPGQQESITELEYRQAVKCGKTCLIFLLHEDASWPGNLWELDAIQRVRSWREELRTSGRIVGFFKGPDDLGRQVAEAVSRWQQGISGPAAVRSVNWDAYCEALTDKYRWVRLDVIAGRARDDQERVPLLDAFVAQPAARGLPMREVVDQETGEAGRESTVEILGRERKQVLLGGPGSGKSTLLQYAMLTLTSNLDAKIRPTHLTAARFPFLIDLRTYALSPARTFIEYLVEDLRPQYVHLEMPSIEEVLDTPGAAVILCDGLDEIFERSTRRKITEEVVSFARRYGTARVIVTSRIVGYKADELLSADFQHYTLHDFGLPEIRRFVPTWYTYFRPRDESRNAESLINQIMENQSLFDLAGNPLLLTMMAIIHRHEPLPEKRWLLYERCAEVLLEDWDLKRKEFDTKDLLDLPFPVRRDQKAKILQEVAMSMLEQRAGGRELNALKLQPLLRIISTYLRKQFNRPPGEADAFAAEILNHVRERTYILAEVGDGIFGFVHRTFMEYFAAAELKAEFGDRKADFAWLRELYAQNWQRDDWREVLLLLMAMLADPSNNFAMDEVIEHVRRLTVKGQPFQLAFAARCIGEAGRIADVHWAQVLVDELVASIAAVARRGTEESIGEYLDQALAAFSTAAAVIPIQAGTLEHIDHLFRAETMRERMAGWQLQLATRSREERLLFALEALRDEGEAIRRGAIAAIEREWPGREEAGTALVNVLRNDKFVRVRQHALEALERGWRRSAAVLEALKSRARTETSGSSAAFIIGYLGRIWPGDEDAVTVVFDLTSLAVRPWNVNYNWHDVAHVAVRQVVEGWRDQPATLEWLQELAREGNDVGRSQVAIGAALYGWADTPGVLEWAFTTGMEKARGHPGVRTRGWIASQITISLQNRYSGDMTAVTAWWERMILETSSPGQRQQDMTELSRSPQGLDLLRRMGTETDDIQLRIDSIKTVSKVSRGDEGTLQWMIQLGKRDEEPEVRLVAAQNSFMTTYQLLLRYGWSSGQLPFSVTDWRFSLVVTEWLCDMAIKDPDPRVRSNALRLLQEFVEGRYPDRLRTDPDFSAARGKLGKFLSRHPSVDDVQEPE